MQFQSKKFRNIETGEIVTLVPLLEIAKYEEVLETELDDSTEPAKAYLTESDIEAYQEKMKAASEFIKSL